MGKDLRGKEIGEGTYCARFVDRFGKRRTKRSKKLQEVKQWLADATYINEHSDIEQATNMMVDAWFEYWIDIKRKTVRPNTVRNYRERYYRNIQKVIGKKLLTEVKPQRKDIEHLLCTKRVLLFIICSNLQEKMM